MQNRSTTGLPNAQEYNDVFCFLEVIIALLLLLPAVLTGWTNQIGKNEFENQRDSFGKIKSHYSLDYGSEVTDLFCYLVWSP